jgi:hypothetical protein
VDWLALFWRLRRIRILMEELLWSSEERVDEVDGSEEIRLRRSLSMSIDGSVHLEELGAPEVRVVGKTRGAR